MRRHAITGLLAAVLLLAAPAARADWFLLYLGPKVGYSIEGTTFGVEDLTGGEKNDAPLGGGFNVGGTLGLKLLDIVGVQANLDYYLLDEPGALTALTFEVFLGPTIADLVEIGVHGGGGLQWQGGDSNPAVKAGALLGFRVHDWVALGVSGEADLWWLKRYAAVNIGVNVWVRLTI